MVGDSGAAYNHLVAPLWSSQHQRRRPVWPHRLQCLWAAVARWQTTRSFITLSQSINTSYRYILLIAQCCDVVTRVVYILESVNSCMTKYIEAVPLYHFSSDFWPDLVKNNLTIFNNFINWFRRNESGMRWVKKTNWGGTLKYVNNTHCV